MYICRCIHKVMFVYNGICKVVIYILYVHTYRQASRASLHRDVLRTSRNNEIATAEFLRLCIAEARITCNLAGANMDMRKNIPSCLEPSLWQNGTTPCSKPPASIMIPCYFYLNTNVFVFRKHIASKHVKLENIFEIHSVHHCLDITKSKYTFMCLSMIVPCWAAGKGTAGNAGAVPSSPVSMSGCSRPEPDKTEGVGKL